ncbi:MAG: hypothetical protein BM556_06170 [Bacteriovorax sp. MedPE-SWde]|nr:MAG: hypothetical protein BM556_06170 [Bacteriovorax sp. MedPE-SWde]
MNKPLLIGSTASPFVRRIRILLSDREFDFKVINVMSPEGQEELAKHSNTRRVPVLIDEGKEIFDSTIMASYLLGRDFSLEEKLFMKEVDEACDAALLLFQLKMFEMDSDRSSRLGKILDGRLKRILTALNEKTSELSDDYGIRENWLYTFLDWLSYREVENWSEYKNLVTFYEVNSSRPEILETNPRV